MKTSPVPLLLDWIDHAFKEEGWHVSFRDSVAGVSAAQASWTPAPGRNSIWMIVEHVALWKEEGARRLQGAPARAAGWAKEHDWRPVRDTSDAGWQAALRRLEDAHRAVRESVEARHGEDPTGAWLDRPVEGSMRSGLATVRGLILHDSYHCGQICYLRALQGIPAKVW